MFQVLMAGMESLVPQVELALLVCLATEVPLDFLELPVLPEEMENLEDQVTVVKQVLPEVPVLEDSPDHLEILVFQVLKVDLVLKATLVFLAALATMDSQACQVQLELEVFKVHLVSLEVPV